MWTAEFSVEAIRDFEMIFDHLRQAYLDFGDAADVSFNRAIDRVNAIQASALALSKAPHQGTVRDDIIPGLRFVRKEKAVFWFLLDEGRQVVQILAVFYGGQDHIRHMLTRLLVP